MKRVLSYVLCVSLLIGLRLTEASAYYFLEGGTGNIYYGTYNIDYAAAVPFHSWDSMGKIYSPSGGITTYYQGNDYLTYYRSFAVIPEASDCATCNINVKVNFYIQTYFASPFFVTVDNFEPAIPPGHWTGAYLSLNSITINAFDDPPVIVSVPVGNQNYIEPRAWALPFAFDTSWQPTVIDASLPASADYMNSITIGFSSIEIIVPEPSALFLLVLGLISLTGLKRIL